MQTQITNKKSKKRFIGFSIFFSIILFLVLGCFYTLIRGIEINHFKISNIEFEKFYLKLDNKLILGLDTLKILPSDSPSTITLQQGLSWFQDSLMAMSYFQKVEIKQIILPNSQTASILYDDKRYELLFPDIVALFELSQDSKAINLKIQKFDAMQYKLKLSGEINFTLAKNQIDFNLTANSYDPLSSPGEKLIIKGKSDLKSLDISAFSTPFKSLEQFRDELKTIPSLQEWLLDRAKFDSVRIKNLFFSAPLNEKFLDRLLASLYAELDFDSASIEFAEGVKPALASKIKAIYRGDKLKFLLEDPTYDKIDLSGSFVELSNFQKDLITKISLKSPDAPLNASIHHLLKAYDIDFDITQTQSFMQLDLDLLLTSKQDDIEVQAQGNFKSKDAKLSLFGTPIEAKSLDIDLQVDKNNSKVLVKNSLAKLNEPEIEGVFDCEIDLNSKTLNGTLGVQNISILADPNSQAKLTQILKITQEDQKIVNFNINFEDDIQINLPDFQTNIILSENNTINLKSLKTIYPHSPMLQQLDFKEGEVAIKTKDFKTFFIQTQINNLNYPIYDKKWNQIKELYATIKVTPSRVYVHSLDESIVLDYADNFLKANLANKNINLQAFLDTKVPILQLSSQDSKPKDQNTIPSNNAFTMYLESKNTAIQYKDYKIATDDIIINIKNNKTTIDAVHKNGIANIDFYDDTIRFKGNNFGSDFINTIMGKDVVNGGLFGIKGVYKNKTMRANVEIQNTVFQNFATLQNIVGLIDTIPSLIVFKKPGLGSDGYQVTQGRIAFELNDQYLGLTKIDLVGTSIDVLGAGLITLATKELNVALTISTIKSLSEVLSKIPIVGYLLLGKEGKISTGVILKGTLDEPKSEISIAEDIISAPFKIIQRIFSTE